MGSDLLNLALSHLIKVAVESLDLFVTEPLDGLELKLLYWFFLWKPFVLLFLSIEKVPDA